MELPLTRRSELLNHLLPKDVIIRNVKILKPLQKSFWLQPLSWDWKGLLLKN